MSKRLSILLKVAAVIAASLSIVAINYVAGLEAALASGLLFIWVLNQYEGVWLFGAALTALTAIVGVGMANADATIFDYPLIDTLGRWVLYLIVIATIKLVIESFVESRRDANLIDMKSKNKNNITTETVNDLLSQFIEEQTGPVKSPSVTKAKHSSNTKVAHPTKGYPSLNYSHPKTKSLDGDKLNYSSGRFIQ